MSFAEFLRMPYAPEPHLNKQDMTPVYYWKYHVESWLGREDVLLVSFREMVEGCEEALKKVAEYTGLKPNHNFVDIRLEKIRQARQHSFLTKLIHRCSKKTKTSSVCPRKGKRGDWRNHFDSEDEALFMEVAGDTLSRLGCIKGETDV
jgi:hypothetical protein